MAGNFMFIASSNALFGQLRRTIHCLVVAVSPLVLRGSSLLSWAIKRSLTLGPITMASKLDLGLA